MQKIGLAIFIITIVLVLLTVTHAFPEKHEIFYCDYSVLTNQETCRVTETHYDDGWLVKAPQTK